MLQPRIPRLRGDHLPSRVAPRTFRRFANSAQRWHDQQQSGAVIGQTGVAVDEDGIPIKPPYSIKAFLESLPTPVISDEQFLHLHKLAALIPPSRGSPEFEEKKKALQDMVRLVEGVRPTQTDPEQRKSDSIPDGRIWPQDEGIHLDWEAIMTPPKKRKSTSSTPSRAQQEKVQDEAENLLKLASKQVAGYYVVKRRQIADTE